MAGLAALLWMVRSPRRFASATARDLGAVARPRPPWSGPPLGPPACDRRLVALRRPPDRLLRAPPDRAQQPAHVGGGNAHRRPARSPPRRAGLSTAHPGTRTSRRRG